MNNKIKEGLLRLSTTPNSRVIFSGAQAWFVVQNYDNALRALIESPAVLAPLDDSVEVPLSADLRAILSRAGYNARRNGRSWGRLVQLDSESALQAISEEIVALMAQVYAIGMEEIGVSFQKSVKTGVINRHLETSIRQLSVKRDQSSRFKLYRDLIQAQLILPLEKKGSDKPRVFGSLMGYSTYAVFTTDKSLRNFDPRGLPLRVITGRRLFPLLKSRRAGSLLINPKGDLGGELYKHEIESICEAMERRR